MAHESGAQIIGCGGLPDEILESKGDRTEPWSNQPLWQLDGIIRGHFLSPNSEDIALSGGGRETHPDFWGGTSLLTMENHKWKPIWYKAGLITRNCHRLSLPSSRQILVCEEADTHMGLSRHFLYTIDFLQPVSLQKSVLMTADSYDIDPERNIVQRQSIDRVEFPVDGVAIRVYARHGIVQVHEVNGVWTDMIPWESTASEYQIEFRFDGEQLTVTPETAEASPLFGVTK
jgi:hypothetical protein